MSAGHFKGPRAGSRLHSWLAKLHEIGGEASAYAWIKAAGWDGSNQKFGSCIGQLIAQGVVYQRGDLYLVSEDGLAWLGVPLDAPRREAPQIVAPRYNAGIRPLSTKNIARMPLMREGAHDYKNIPSLMSGTHVPFKYK